MPWGGKRRGAGAPKGNRNALKHGLSRMPRKDLVPLIEWLIKTGPDLFVEQPPVLFRDDNGDPWLDNSGPGGAPVNPFTGRHVRPRRNSVAAIRQARLRLQAQIRRDYHCRLIDWYLAECQYQQDLSQHLVDRAGQEITEE